MVHKNTILVVILFLSVQIIDLRLIHNVPSLRDNFQKEICFGCDPSSPVCQNNLKFINSSASTNYFDISIIENNKLGITKIFSQVRNVTKNYHFPTKNLTNATMDYLLLYPIFPTNQKNQLKGVLIYFHPTVLGKNQVPTQHGNQIQALAALYCSQGYALVIPNYIGYQYDSETVHPNILYPQQNVQSAISALNDALFIIPHQFQFNLFSMGYSEGAAYSLWMGKCLSDLSACPYNTQKLQLSYNFKGSVGLDGPYDLKDVVYPFLWKEISQKVLNTYQIMSQSATNLGKPYLISELMNSYAYYENIEDLSKFYQKEFYEMLCPSTTQKYCEINGKKYENIKAILQSNETSIDIIKAIAYSSFGKMQYGIKYLTEIQPRFLSETNNNILALVNKDILSQNAFTVYLQNSSAIRNAPSKKVFIFSLEKDSIVSVKSSEQYFETYNSTNRVKFEKFPNKQHKICTETASEDVDHSGAHILANIYALAFINNQTSLN